MIIKCEQCQTKFRLDDSKVTGNGVKVRCTKCKYVFTVHKDQPEFESSASVETVSSAPSDVHVSSVASAEGVDMGAVSSMFGEKASGSPFAQSVAGDFSAEESAPPDTSSIDFGSDDFFTSDTDNTPVPAAEPVARSGEVDFSSFDFGDSDSEPDVAPTPTMAVDDFSDNKVVASLPPQKEAPQGLDFSDDDMFGAVLQTTPEAPAETISFDFEGDSFAESMDMSGQDSGGKRGSTFSLDAPGDAPFSLGEIDFGDELTSVAVQQINPEDLKPSQESLFAPLAAAQEKSADDELTRAFLGEVPVSAQEELPPLSIASRRKQSPFFGAFVAVIAVFVLSALGYLGYSSLSGPKEGASIENGKITLRSVKATFIENDEAGELLVVSGEAFNEYSKPRAALQVKVTVFDGSGQSVAAKTAYGGNPMPEDLLESLSLEKIEAAMANQFGDSLANMEVAPGKAIPFVVVLANLPEGAKDFSVQSAGSTVATGKNQ